MKLHLGCGKRYIPGFIHMDVEPFEHLDVFGDIRSLYMFENDSIDLIYCCHALEHFSEPDILTMLLEWRSKLKSHGVLRLSVPDFGVIARGYANNEFSLKDIHGPLMGGKKGTYDYHETLFDLWKLQNILGHAGFVDMRRWDWKNTEHTFVDDYSQAYLPHMDKENGTLISLNMEAIKP